MSNDARLPCALCIMGPPASGKGSLAKAIRARYRIVILSVGDIYREIRTRTDPLGELVSASLRDGGYCPDWLTNKLVPDLAHAHLQPGTQIAFDGYPRTIAQLEGLQDGFEVTAYIDLTTPLESLLERVKWRRNCPVCSRVYSLKDWTSYCGCGNSEKGMTRWDDEEYFFKKRYAVYETLSLPVRERLLPLANFKLIDSTCATTLVEQACQWLEALAPEVFVPLDSVSERCDS